MFSINYKYTKTQFLSLYYSFILLVSNFEIKNFIYHQI